MRARVRLSLTQTFALWSLVPMLVLGFVLYKVIEGQIVDRTLADASRSSQLIARLAIQPRLTPAELAHGLTGAQVHGLDQQLEARSVTRDLARIKIWNAGHEVIYSDDHALIGKHLAASEDLLHALHGAPAPAEVVTPSRGAETASEVGLGRLVEVYVPLRFSPGQAPAGAFEIYLSYKPLAAALSADKRDIAMVVFAGLALLWGALFRIAAGTNRRLRRQADENDRLARYDPLTSLPNRTLFIERTAGAIAQGVAHGHSVAVLMLDVDNFKNVNDTLGHKVGDVVLREVAHRLAGRLASGAVAARLGADEYALLCPSVAGHSEALEIAKAVHTALDAPVALEGVALNVDASIGIAIAPEHATDADELLQHADVALDRARSYRTRTEVYRPDYDLFDAGKLALLGEVRRALAEREFTLRYQPKLDLATGKVTGVEALLRWEHPSRGLLGPMEFIPVIEPTSLMGPVSLYVIDSALDQLTKWRQEGIYLDISVNLSARNLLDKELPSQIERLLDRHEVPKQRLTVEVTESATMANPEGSVAVLEELRALGIGVSIDDFGTGHASLAYLSKLPANELKIDRSLVTNICEDARDQAIVRSTIDLARHLDLQVVAEGIETDQARALLARLGCHTGQGFLISRPVDAAELSAWLAAPGAHVPAPGPHGRSKESTIVR